GSSQTRANAFVPCGGAVHSSAGETSAPSQVCFLGMSPPCANDELFSSKPIAVLPGTTTTESAQTATATPLQPRRDTRATVERTRLAVQRTCGTLGRQRRPSERPRYPPTSVPVAVTVVTAVPSVSVSITGVEP